MPKTPSVMVMVIEAPKKRAGKRPKRAKHHKRKSASKHPRSKRTGRFTKR